MEQYIGAVKYLINLKFFVVPHENIFGSILSLSEIYLIIYGEWSQDMLSGYLKLDCWVKQHIVTVNHKYIMNDTFC